MYTIIGLSLLLSPLIIFQIIALTSFSKFINHAKNKLSYYEFGKLETIIGVSFILTNAILFSFFLYFTIYNSEKLIFTLFVFAYYILNTHNCFEKNKSTFEIIINKIRNNNNKTNTN